MSFNLVVSVERLSRSEDRLNLSITYWDPILCKKPFTVHYKFRDYPEKELLEYVCTLENLKFRVYSVMKNLAALIFLIFVTIPGICIAHHFALTNFDSTNTIAREKRIMEVSIFNPHCTIKINVTNEEGESEV